VKKIWLVVIGVVLLIGLVGLAGCVSEPTPSSGNINISSQQQGIWVTGEGKINVVPDVAILTLGIEAQDVNVAGAQTKASEAMDKVMQALEDQGIAEEDIQTVYFNISEVTKWDSFKEETEVTGYRVTNTVNVKVREIEKAGQVIDAVVTAGGDMTRINNITFTVDEPSPYYVQARDLAITYAKQKAEQLASGAGIELGKITYMTESSYTYGPMVRNYVMEDVSAAPAPAVTPPISAGQLEITATVTIVYDIAD